MGHAAGEPGFDCRNPEVSSKTAYP